MNKTYCCKEGKCGDLNNLNVDRFQQIKEVIQTESIPYTCDNLDLMVCSPVGNQGKYTKHEVDIVLSGYSTAPDAAIPYLLDRQKDDFRECRYAFNTPTMENGICSLLESIGFVDGHRIFNLAVNPNENSNRPTFLFTQMLCMISANGGSKASEVEKVLRTKEVFLTQANASLNAWYDRINDCLKENGLVLIMGDQAMNLLNHAWFEDDGSIFIDYNLNKNRLRESLYTRLNGKFSVFKVMHAAGIRYPRNRRAWQDNNNRKLVYHDIDEHYPNILRPVPEMDFDE